MPLHIESYPNPLSGLRPSYIVKSELVSRNIVYADKILGISFFFLAAVRRIAVLPRLTIRPSWAVS